MPHWTEEQVWDYVRAHDVPVNPLLHQGYKSMRAADQGRFTTTRTPGPAGGPGWTRPECGIHFDDGRCQPGGRLNQALSTEVYTH